MQNWREEKGPGTCFSFSNCLNFVTIFYQVLKMEIILIDIPINPPPIAVRNSLTNQFFPKKLTILYIFNNKKMQNWREEKGHFSFLDCPNCVTIFCQVLNMEIFFLISLAIPRLLRSRIHWPIIFFKKNWCLCIFATKKKVKILYRDIHPGDSWPYGRLLSPIQPKWLEIQQNDRKQTLSHMYIVYWADVG